jgi:hypothetical protein
LPLVPIPLRGIFLSFFEAFSGYPLQSFLGFTFAGAAANPKKGFPLLSGLVHLSIEGV